MNLYNLLNNSNRYNKCNLEYKLEYKEFTYQNRSYKSYKCRIIQNQNRCCWLEYQSQNEFQKLLAPKRKFIYLSEEVRIRLRYYRSYRSSYYYYYYSYSYTTLSTGAIVGIVIGSLGGVILFIVGCVFLCVCCCACCKGSTSNTGQVISRSQNQTTTVATISSSQMTAVGPNGYSDPNSPVQNSGLQQQPDGYRYHAPPPAYGQAVNYGFESK